MKKIYPCTEKEKRVIAFKLKLAAILQIIALIFSIISLLMD